MVVGSGVPQMMMSDDWRGRGLSQFLVFTKDFTARLKDNLTRLKVFYQGTSSFNPQSWFPDHSAESTGRDCIDSSGLSP